MLLLSLMFLTSLAPAPAHALDVCRRARTSSNSFDDAETIIPSPMGSVLLGKDGPIYKVRVSASGVNAVQLKPGWPFTVALEDGTKVTFHAKEAINPVGTAYATQYTVGVFTSWDVRAVVSPDAAVAIAQSRPVAVRYDVAGSETTSEIKRGAGNAVSAAFACAVQKMQ